jgi:hypothetical protein
MSLIETVTVGSGGASSIEFTSIPQDGTDLVLIMSIRGASGGGNGLLYFNDSTSNYSSIRLLGTGSEVLSQTTTTAGRNAGLESSSTTTSNTFSNTQIYITNYAGSANKTFSVDSVTENNATAANQSIQVTTWANTSAITKIVYSSQDAASLAQHSTISLYKVTKGSDGTTVVS